MKINEFQMIIFQKNRFHARGNRLPLYDNRLPELQRSDFQITTIVIDYSIEVIDYLLAKSSFSLF